MRLSTGPSALNYLGAHGRVWDGFKMVSQSFFSEQHHQQKIPDTVIGFFGDLVVGEAIYFVALIIKLPLLPSSCVFLQPSQDSSETRHLIKVL